MATVGVKGLIQNVLNTTVRPRRRYYIMRLSGVMKTEKSISTRPQNPKERKLFLM